MNLFWLRSCKLFAASRREFDAVLIVLLCFVSVVTVVAAVLFSTVLSMVS